MGAGYSSSHWSREVDSEAVVTAVITRQVRRKRGDDHDLPTNYRAFGPTVGDTLVGRAEARGEDQEMREQ